MKNVLLSSLFAVVTCFLGIRPVLAAEAVTIEQIEDALKQAEASSDPATLLQKAKEDLTKFGGKAPANPGRGKKSGTEAAFTKRKEEALRAIDDAINTAKNSGSSTKDNSLGSATAAGSGQDAKAKIEDALMKVKLAGELKK
jgi:hypothetical protein